MSDPGIRPIDAHSVHRITSGQVVTDLQTAVKELVENSLDAGATNIEVRFQNYGLKAIEVVDNGSGIAPKDHDSISLKHYTSKLSSFEDLSRVLTFGFRGEALSSLCALSDAFTVTTATSSEAPMGTILEMDRNGKVRTKSKVARQRGTSVSVSNLFKPLPVRRKELERNIKREFQKALNLLHAYALVPCAKENKGVRLTVSNSAEGGRKVIQFKTDGTPSVRSSVLSIWGSKALENVVDLDLSFDVETEKSVLRRIDPGNDTSTVTPIKVQGLISKFAVGAGRTSSDRQFFFVNGRPYNPGKVQKAINEVYRTFNANQSPFIIADIILPTHACDINVSPDKRTIFLHSENNLVQALKTALETTFSSARSTYDVTSQTQQGTQQAKTQGQTPTQTQARKLTQAEKDSQQGPTTNPSSPKPTSTAAPQYEDPRARESRPLSPSANRDDWADADGGGGEDDDGGRDRNRNEPLTMGVPHLLLGTDARAGAGDRHEEEEPETEPEPEPTLVAQPGVTNVGKSAQKAAEHPRSRTPPESESLFFPESDEEEGGAAKRLDKGKARASDEASAGEEHTNDRATSRSRPPISVRSSTNATAGASTSTSTRTNTHTHTVRASTSVPDKPRSVQTVLSTRGAAWNLNLRRDRDDDGDEAGSGRERKRMKSAGEVDRERREKSMRRKSFRSSLSQFVSVGGKMAATADEEEESGKEADKEKESDVEGREEEVDELDEEEEEPSKKVSKATSRRKRRGSDSSQVTVVVPSDDERDMDVDEPPPIMKASTATSPLTAEGPQDQDIVDLTGDDWELSSTLVGTYVPPTGKTSTRPLAQADPDSVTLQVNLISIGSHYIDIYNSISSSHSPHHPPQTPNSESTLRSAVSCANLETAAEDTVASAALSRIISKSDFERMSVVGQFNLGFIIVRKRSDTPGNTMDDLFIVDQHAADEKWNFETLQEKTVIASQKLFRSQPLQFTAADELLAVENMEVLKSNGFELSRVKENERSELDDEDEDREDEGSARSRLELVALPMSKDTVFDMKDLEELIHLMRDRPIGTMVRCSKARAMFAMRACRRSVMIGKALDKSRMMAIVRHMGTMDQPWNCPHGRPTMRHLSDLSSFGRYDPPRPVIDWEAFGMEGDDSGMEMC